MIELYGINFGTSIADKKVQIGMTKEMLLKSWGKPSKIDGRVIRKNSVKEYYHYSPYKNNRGNIRYKQRITIVNDFVEEIKHN